MRRDTKLKMAFETMRKSRGTIICSGPLNNKLPWLTACSFFFTVSNVLHIQIGTSFKYSSKDNPKMHLEYDIQYTHSTSLAMCTCLNFTLLSTATYPRTVFLIHPSSNRGEEDPAMTKQTAYWHQFQNNVILSILVSLL